MGESVKKIIIFAKDPVPGKVKTRLCPPLSPEQAASLYKSFAKDVVKAALEVHNAEVEIAWCGEKIPVLTWLNPSPLPVFLQEGANLGERLTHAIARAFKNKATRVVVVGSDSPGLTPKDFEKAFDILDDGSDVALGPAEDGGYYLIGLKKPIPGIFEGISWSTDRTLKETMTLAKRLNVSIDLLSHYTDIDTFDDILRLSGSISKSQAHYFSCTQKALQELELV